MHKFQLCFRRARMLFGQPAIQLVSENPCRNHAGHVAVDTVMHPEGQGQGRLELTQLSLLAKLQVNRNPLGQAFAFTPKNNKITDSILFGAVAAVLKSGYKLGDPEGDLSELLWVRVATTNKYICKRSS